MVRGALAQAGVLVFGVSMIVPSLAWSHTRGGGEVVVASAFGGSSENDLREVPLAPSAAAPAEALPEEVAAAQTPAPAPAPLARAPQPAAPAAVAPPSAPAATPFALPSLEAPAVSGIVVASWYGPGFYGNRTACGQTYTAEILGVAHRTLPCGTLVTLTFRGGSVTVPVIDRGPYIAGRALDLSNATRLALGCTDLCTLSMRVGR